MGQPVNFGICVGDTHVQVATIASKNELKSLANFWAQITFTEKKIKISSNFPSKNRLRLIPLIKSTSKCCNAIHLKNMIFPLADEEALAIYFQETFRILQEADKFEIGSVVVTLPFTPTSSEREKIQQSLKIIGISDVRVFSSMIAAGVVHARKYFAEKRKQPVEILMLQVQKQSFTMSIVRMEQNAIFVTKRSKETFPEDHSLLFKPEELQSKMFDQILKSYKQTAKELQLDFPINTVRIITTIRNIITLQKLLERVFTSSRITFAAEDSLTGACILASQSSFFPSSLNVHEVGAQHIKIQCDSKEWVIPLEGHRSFGVIFEEKISVSPNGSNILLNEHILGHDNDLLVGQYKALSASPIAQDAKASFAVLTCSLKDSGNFSINVNFPHGTQGQIFRMDNWLVGLSCDTITMRNLLQYYQVRGKVKMTMAEENPELIQESHESFEDGVRESLEKYSKAMQPLLCSQVPKGQLTNFHEEILKIFEEQFLLSNRQNMIAGRGAVNHFLKLMNSKINSSYETFRYNYREIEKYFLFDSIQNKIPASDLGEELQEPPKEQKVQDGEINPKLLNLVEETLQKLIDEGLKSHKRLVQDATDRKEPYTDKQIKKFHDDNLEGILRAFDQSFLLLLSEFTSLKEVVSQARVKLEKRINNQLTTYLKRHETVIERISKTVKGWTLEAETVYDAKMEEFNPKNHTQPEVKTKHKELEQDILQTFNQNFKDAGYEAHDCWKYELNSKLAEWETESLDVAFPDLNTDALNQNYHPLSSPALIKLVSNLTSTKSNDLSNSDVLQDLNEEADVRNSEGEKISSNVFDYKNTDSISQQGIIKIDEEELFRDSAYFSNEQEIPICETSTNNGILQVNHQELQGAMNVISLPTPPVTSQQSLRIDEELIRQIIKQSLEESVIEGVKIHQTTMFKLTDLGHPFTDTQIRQHHNQILQAILSSIAESYQILINNGHEQIIQGIQDRTTQQVNLQLLPYTRRHEEIITKITRAIHECVIQAENSYDQRMDELNATSKSKTEILEIHHTVKEFVVEDFRNQIHTRGIEWQDHFKFELESSLEKKLLNILTDSENNHNSSIKEDDDSTSNSDGDTEEVAKEGEEYYVTEVEESGGAKEINVDGDDKSLEEKSKQVVLEECIEAFNNGEEVTIWTDDMAELPESNQHDLYDYFRSFTNPDLNLLLPGSPTFGDFNEDELIELAKATPIYSRHYLGTIFEDPIEEEISELENQLSVTSNEGNHYILENDDIFDSSSSFIEQDCPHEELPITEIEEHEDIEEIQTEIITTTTETYPGLCGDQNCQGEEQNSNGNVNNKAHCEKAESRFREKTAAAKDQQNYQVVEPLVNKAGESSLIDPTDFSNNIQNGYEVSSRPTVPNEQSKLFNGHSQNGVSIHANGLKVNNFEAFNELNGDVSEGNDVQPEINGRGEELAERRPSKVDITEEEMHSKEEDSREPSAHPDKISFTSNGSQNNQAKQQGDDTPSILETSSKLDQIFQSQPKIIEPITQHLNGNSSSFESKTNYTASCNPQIPKPTSHKNFRRRGAPVIYDTTLQIKL